MTEGQRDCIALKEHFEKVLEEKEQRFRAELKARDIAVKLAHDNAKQAAVIWAAGLSIVINIILKLIK